MQMIDNVEILYPRINRTYHFDQAENRSVPCDPLAENAAYETKFLMTKDQAKALFKCMAEAYAEKRENKWPEKLDMPFEKHDDGRYIGKAKLKGAYSGEPTKKPLQVDAKGKELPEDFQLTTGSTCNLAVIFVPYNMRDHGVSLRLKAVQVVQYAEMKADNPFGEVEGFDQDEGSDNPFATKVDAVAKTKELPDDGSDDLFGDDEEPAEAPPKKVARKKATPKVEKADASDLESLVSGWDDE
mgnify:CR=1 FL=1